ncbi:terpene synthase family protein [Nocardia terpenica]|uniref:Terpene synthase n=1 Tax=Nocardia terpenica TaxID=455432 RepID=A0A6G9Z238_9NOCA|nr:hypothetical protein [Nocardia terpenica]QIS19542.1 hypothetical protein F6W96_15875 [Nocardia terpenica]
MSASLFPVTYRPTGIGTAAADVARWLAADAVAAVGHTGYDTASSDGNPVATEFERSMRRFLRTPAPRSLQHNRFDEMNALSDPVPKIAPHAFGRIAGEASQEAIDIPPVWCPLPLRSRGDGMKFQRRTEEFYRSMEFDAGSLNTVREVCAGELACMWAADGDDEGIQLLSDWLPWPFLFDDRYCDDGPMAHDPTRFNHLAMNLMHFTLYPERSPLGIEFADTLTTALTDIMARVRIRAPREQALMCALAHYRWALGAACGVSDRSGHYTRSVDEHLIARPADGADMLDIYLSEIAESTWLDPAALNNPAVRAITDAAGVALTVATDIGSYAHERNQHSLESNIVQVIATERGCSQQDAMYAACALIEEIMELFVSLKEKLSASGTSNLRRYLEQLSNMISGVLEWQRRLPRYAKNFGNTQPNFSNGRLSEHATHTLTEQRIFPKAELPASIRWWWDFV